MMNAQRRSDVLDREGRIEQLKARAEELSTGSSTSFTHDEGLLEDQEEFWRRVEEVEESGLTTLARAIEEGGFELPVSDQLTDEQLARKLWALIGRMAELRCFLTNTDHLSDRELYTQLVEETLQEEIEAEALTAGPNQAYHYDLIGGGSEEDIQIMLRYYTTVEDREQWHADFPDDVIPPMRSLPYDRDRLLPKWEVQ